MLAGNRVLCSQLLDVIEVGCTLIWFYRITDPKCSSLRECESVGALIGLLKVYGVKVNYLSNGLCTSGRFLPQSPLLPFRRAFQGVSPWQIGA